MVILGGLIELLTFQNIFLMLLATIGGIAVGALPGLTATMAVALLVPLTFVMSPTTGLAVLGALYMSAIYGGAFSAILINTPGTPGSIATAFDGYPMAQKGEGIKAVIGATIASMIGGIIGVLALFFFAPPLANIALRFGPPEYFWLAIFGLTIMASLGEGSIIKTLMGGLLGLLLSSIGITRMAGELRFGFGFYQLQGGIALIAALIGLFCIPEALAMLGADTALYKFTGKVQKIHGIWKESIKDIFHSKRILLQASFIGTITGILPGAGGTIANLIAYNKAKKSSKQPETFGKGNFQGVLAPEAANNATVGSGLIPTLTLGIPGTPVAAIIYGALLLHGIRPGPELFIVYGEVVYAFMFALLISVLMLGVIGMTMGIGTYKIISKIPIRFLAPTIILLSITGSYAIRNNFTDVWMMLILGLLGYFLKKINISTGAVVLGLILGPIAEEGLGQSVLMARAHGLVNIFFMRPISLAIIILTISSFLWPIITSLRKKRSKKNDL